MRLELLSEAHLAAVDRMLEDPESLRRTLVPEPVPPGFSRTWLERYEEGRRDGTREAFAAIGDDGDFLGLALVPVIEPDAAQAELGYMVAPEHRGRGVGTDMLRELTHWAFGIGMQRVYLQISADNPASVRLAEKAGFQHEGTLRSVHFKQGMRLDLVVMSRLPSDP